VFVEHLPPGSGKGMQCMGLQQTGHMSIWGSCQTHEHPKVLPGTYASGGPARQQPAACLRSLLLREGQQAAAATWTSWA
jgi:hypothetical protein